MTDTEALTALVQAVHDAVERNRSELERHRVEANQRFDAMPTRREFDTMTASIENVRSEFNKFVLRTEFMLSHENTMVRLAATNKALDDKFALVVPRSEIEGQNKLNQKHFEDIDEKISGVGKPAPWLVAVLVGIAINASVIFGEHILTQPQNAAGNSTTTTSSSYNNNPASSRRLP